MRPGSAVYELSNGATLELPVQGEHLLKVPENPTSTGFTRREEGAQEAARLLGSLKRTLWEEDPNGQWSKLGCRQVFDREDLDGSARLESAYGVPRSLLLLGAQTSDTDFRVRLEKALADAQARSMRAVVPRAPVSVAEGVRVPVESQTGADVAFIREAFFNSVKARGFHIIDQQSQSGTSVSGQWLITNGPSSANYVEIGQETGLFFKGNKQFDLKGMTALELERCFAEAKSSS